MKVDQIYTGCLAQGAYFIESNGEAAIIDPLREVKPYLQELDERGAKLRYIFETHFHADFVSGHLDLAKTTGAEIVYGPTADPTFNITKAQDRQIFSLGKVTIEVLHTPGHTLESSCFLLRDEHGAVHALFTGDTVFLGDVGRPDLAVKSDLSKEQLAGMLYDSIWQKIMPLPEETIIYPGHGAGSACGKNMSTETVDKLGNQRQNNYALQPMNKQAFVDAVLEGQTTPPQYFPKNAVLNKTGYDNIDGILAKGLKALDPDVFETTAQHQEALILDVRHEREFVKSHIPNSLFIGLHDNFAPWVGTLISDLQQPILLVAPEGKEEEAITRLARVGYDNTIGFLKGGFEAWQKSGKAVENISTMSADAFAKNAQNPGNVLDVRRPAEFQNGHLQGAHNLPLDYINDHLQDFSPNEEYTLHCQGGYRSVIMASILKANGIKHIVNIADGYEALDKTSLPKEEAQLA